MSSIRREGENEEEEGPEPVLYIRCIAHGSHYWAVLDNNNVLSNEMMLCDCGADADLPPCFTDKSPADSAIVAVGSRIYSFGGYNYSTDNFSDQVSYIDTLRPQDGWQVCNNRMLRPQCLSYVIALDDDRLFLVGGEHGRSYDPTFTQMYYPKLDKWVFLDNNFSNPKMCGHAVVNKNLVLMHGCGSSGLYSYNVEYNSWGRYWGDGFGDCKHTSAYVDGIYYVLDATPKATELNLGFSGYDIFLDEPKPLPVEVCLPVGRDDVEWVPAVDWNGCMSMAKLVSLGNSKLAMVWEYHCLLDEDPFRTRLLVICSIFRMFKEKNKGELKLVALPLSNNYYHLDGHIFDSCLAVFPSKNTNKKRKMFEENEKKE